MPDKRLQRKILQPELKTNASSKLDTDTGVVRLTAGTVPKPSQDLDEDAPDVSEANALDLCSQRQPSSSYVPAVL
ncbi:hypothetical protein BGW80DRAFT_1566227 [Lactifluus volemus]|nr:hypothetical protein BGW80DRAFT_1566227 [Lactifluus volemus]